MFLFLFQESAHREIARNIDDVNQNKDPTHFIGQYAVLELLGTGGFGSVYKVREKSGQTLLAMKEVRYVYQIITSLTNFI